MPTNLTGVETFLQTGSGSLTALATLGAGAAGFTNGSCPTPTQITS